MKSKFLFLLILFPLCVIAQITQIGTDIDGEAAEDKSGWSVSLSNDGNIVAISARLNDGINGIDSGHVRVYENAGGMWTQIGDDIDGEAADDRSGYTIGLNSNGSIIAVGATNNDGINGTDSGHVRVYQNNGGVWTQVGADIDGEAAGDFSSSSLSLNSDGSIVAIGATFNNGNGQNSGHVRVYQNTGGAWMQIGDDIDGEAMDDRSGSSVSLSADGSIVAIGAFRNDGNGTDSGHVRVYQNTGGVWNQVGADIDGEDAGDFSGSSVSLNADGSIVAIGSSFNNGNGLSSGHVRVYQNAGGTWLQIGDDIDGEAADDYSGFSVSLNDYGNILAIGAILNDGNGLDSGHVRIYQNTEGLWSQMGLDIDGEAAGDESGHSVSISSDGSIVAIGAINNDENGTDSGHVRLFDLSTVLGIAENSLSEFSVYPNPTSGIININSETSITQLEIYNLLGQVVKSNTNQKSIDISSVDQGVYFIKVMDENGNVGSQKVVKE